MVKCSWHWEKCACDEVFCFHAPSRARHSPMSVREIWEKNLHGCERVCSHHSFHQCWSRHRVSWCSRCHHCCADDEEEVCDQWVFKLWLCHSRSTRNASSIGLCRALSFFGILTFCRPGSCRRLVRVCVVDLKSFRARIGPACLSSSLDASKMLFSYQFRWCQVALWERSIVVR